MSRRALLRILAAAPAAAWLPSRQSRAVYLRRRHRYQAAYPRTY